MALGHSDSSVAGTLQRSAPIDPPELLHVTGPLLANSTPGEMNSDSWIYKDHDVLRRLTSLRAHLHELRLSDRLEMVGWQIDGVKRVLLPRLKETLSTEGLVLDVHEAQEILDQLCTQLFHSKLLQNAQKELTSLHEQIWAESAKGADLENLCDKHITDAKQRKDHFDMLRHTFGRILEDYQIPYVLGGSWFAVLSSPAMVRKNRRKPFRAALFAGAAIAMAGYTTSSYIKWIKGDDCDNFSGVPTSLKKKIDEASYLKRVCLEAGTFFQQAIDKVKALSEHEEFLTQLSQQIKHLLTKKRDVRAMGVEVFGEFLETCALGHLRSIFREHHVDGQSFVEVVTEEDLRDMGVTRSLDLRKLMHCQAQARDGDLTERSPQLQSLVERAEHFLDRYAADVNQVKDKAKAWRTFFQSLFGRGGAEADA